MPAFVNWNGKIVKEEQVVISPGNRSFRYGDGCFETMKVINGKILLNTLHFERLFTSLLTLKFSVTEYLSSEYLSSQIIELVQANQHTSLARVRMVFYRGDGGLYDLQDNHPNFIIQSWQGNESFNYFNETGLIADFYHDAKKTSDKFSAIKTNNFLPYLMGAIWAKENNLDDCFLLNASGRLADATIANIFIISDGVIKTPLLTEGCIGGVMRRYLLNSFKDDNIPFIESETGQDELQFASEVFLTNATYGIRWVEKVGGFTYTNTTSAILHQRFIAPLFHASNL